MIARRTFSPEELNAIVNHPSVRPTIETKVPGRLDTAFIVTNPANVVMVGEAGAFIFAGLGCRRYLAHVAIIDRHRGQNALALGRSAFAALFGLYDAGSCLAEAPLHLPQVSTFARMLGFRSVIVDPDMGIEHLIKESA